MLVMLRFRSLESVMLCFDIQHSPARISCHSRLLVKLHGSSQLSSYVHDGLQILLGCCKCCSSNEQNFIRGVL
jgi:hypothetical protein